jgi:hypothetical protein
MEAIIATVIAVIAVLGLAHTFGLGRGFAVRFEVARMALGIAQSRMEALTVLPSTDPSLAIGTHPATPLDFTYRGVPIGTETWRVEWYDDPASSALTTDLKRVTVLISWQRGADTDSVQLVRLFPY